MLPAASTANAKESGPQAGRGWIGVQIQPVTTNIAASLGMQDGTGALVAAPQDPESAAFVEKANGGNQTVPTVLFADGSTLTNPSLAQVKQKVGV